jgi:hypothetical protein
MKLYNASIELFCKNKNTNEKVKTVNIKIISNDISIYIIDIFFVFRITYN